MKKSAKCKKNEIQSKYIMVNVCVSLKEYLIMIVTDVAFLRIRWLIGFLCYSKELDTQTKWLKHSFHFRNHYLGEIRYICL